MFETLDGDSIVWRGGGETLVVQAWGDNSLRVRSRMMGDILDSDFALLTPDESDPQILIDGERAMIRNGELEAILTAKSIHDGANMWDDEVTCEIEFRSGNRTLIREIPRAGVLRHKARDFDPIAGGDHRLVASFESDPQERLYGMGQYQQTTFNLKGSLLELAHRNSQASIPFVLSSAGYGFFWHNPSIGSAMFGLNKTQWRSESTQQLDYWITAGKSPAEILSSYVRATGLPPMMPEYGLGLWQCKLRYSTQEEILEVAREYQRRDLPLNVIVADFFHWPRMGDYRFDEQFYPDPRAMVDELNTLGVELMVSIWPQVALTSENYQEMRDKNLLIRSERGPDVQMRFYEPSVFFDATNPAAREYVWNKARENYHDNGVRVFWLDEAEPEFEGWDYAHYRTHLGSVLQVGNLYPQLYARGFHEGQLAAGQQSVANLVRSAWAGSQRYGTIVWSGDIRSTWEDFRKQVVAGLQMGLSGIPWWTTDIGGFFGGNPDDAGFRELMIRWFQWGTFCPVMRMHGFRLPEKEIVGPDGRTHTPTGAGNEVWSFGEEAYGILASYLRLRERLRPYTRVLMQEAHETGKPVIRPMFFEFPEDEETWALSDQYMFGPDVLVAPVLGAGLEHRDVYLPPGTWRELNSSLELDGGRSVSIPLDIATMPVFVKGGSLAELDDWTTSL